MLTALTVGLIWTILELTPKSALMSLPILYAMRNYVPGMVESGVKGVVPSHILADQLPLSQPGGGEADYDPQFTTCPQDFQIFRHPCVLCMALHCTVSHTI